LRATTLYVTHPINLALNAKYPKTPIYCFSENVKGSGRCDINWKYKKRKEYHTIAILELKRRGVLQWDDFKSGCRAAEIRRMGLEDALWPIHKLRISSHRRIRGRIRFDPAQSAGVLMLSSCYNTGIMGTPCDSREQGAATNTSRGNGGCTGVVTPVHRPMAPPGLARRALRNWQVAYHISSGSHHIATNWTNLYATPGIDFDQTPIHYVVLRPTAPHVISRRQCDGWSHDAHTRDIQSFEAHSIRTCDSGNAVAPGTVKCAANLAYPARSPTVPSS